MGSESGWRSGAGELARVFLNTPTGPGQAPFMENAEEEVGEAWSVEEWRGFVERYIGNASIILADCQLIY